MIGLNPKLTRMLNPKVIIKNIFDIHSVPTSHNIGLKTVLLSDCESNSNITQIAVTSFRIGEQVESHVHKTMDEHYLFIEGKARLEIDGEIIGCSKGSYVLVPAGCFHRLLAETDLKFISIGIAL